MNLPAFEPTQVAEFPNGLTLLVREDPSAPVVSVQGWVRTGSVHEGNWLGSGVSHLIEHLVFKGTERRPVGTIAREVQGLGGSVNAYTTFDRTVYHVDAPSAGWRELLDLIVDAVFHSTLPESEYAKECEVIRREFAMGNDNPQHVLAELLFATAYRVHPYRHPIIGHLDIFNRLTRDDVAAHYRARYVPNNVTLVVVGDVSFDAVRAEVGTLVAGLARAPLPEIILPVEPRQLARRDAHVPFATELAHLMLAWHVPPLTHDDVHALDLLAVILGQGRSSRLERRVLEEGNLVHSISAWVYSPGEPGLFGVSATTDADLRAEAERAILGQVDDVAKSGVSQAELDKARRQTLAAFLGQRETMAGQAADIGAGWFLAHNPDYSRAYLERLHAVDPAEIQHVAATHLRTANLTATSVNPRGASTPASVAGRPSASESGIHVQRLPGGARLVTRHLPRLPLVSVRAAWLGGLSFEDASNHGITRLAGNVLVKGTTSRDAETIAAEIEALGGTLDADSGLNTQVLSMELLESDFERGLDVFADVLLNPAFPADEVDRERDLQLAAIQAESDRPVALCHQLLCRALYHAGHPYGLPHLGSEASLAALDSNALRAWHRARLVSEGVVFAVFGAVDAGRAAAAITERFKGLATGTCPAFPPALARAAAGGGRFEQPTTKEQAIVMVGVPGVDVTDPDRTPLDLVEDALADMGSRLFMRIREEQGLAYFVGARQRVGLLPGHFVLYAGCEAAKADHVANELADELRQLAAQGLPPAELERARAKMLGSLIMQRQGNAQLAGACLLDELFGLGAKHVDAVERQLRSIGEDELRAVCARHFAAEPTVAILRPGA
jgi:zinc protease